jgi:ADP-heptose:LPS heptosyltransferase
MSFLAPWPPGPAHAARRLVAARAALDGGTEAAWPGSPRALAEHPLLRLEPREIEQTLRQLNLAALPPRGILVLHPGSGGAAKCWPAKRFAELAAAAARHWGVLPVFLIGPADASAWHEVQAALPPSLAALALVERPLREVLALLSLARAYVGNDSGISHLAGRACPTLALFGPSDPRVWHPLGSRVVILAAESGNLARLSAEEVGAALGGLLAP